MEKLLVEFARHTDRTRFVPHFVSLESRGALAAEIEACGSPVTALEEPPGVRPGLVLRLAQLFRRLQAGVVHTHNSKPLLYGGLAARLARVPRVIHTRHGQRYQATRRQTLVFRCASWLTDRVVCVSEDSRRLSAADGIPTNRLYTIRNGIDVTRFLPSGPKLDGPAVVVSRLSPEKGADTLLRAVALVIRERPSFRLEVAGNGPCLRPLQRLADELGISRHVRFLGTVQDVAGLLSRASFFVLHSLTEGISLTILEAMAKGLPVVTTGVGGSPEVVVNGVTGLLVPPREPKPLADAMLQLLRDPAMAQQMGHAGRDRVEQDFDIRQTIGAYEKLYTNPPNGAPTLPSGHAEAERRTSTALSVHGE
jgi:glycosyltransferase involved in cell wall biosynthesis